MSKFEVCVLILTVIAVLSLCAIYYFTDAFAVADIAIKKSIANPSTEESQQKSNSTVDINTADLVELCTLPGIGEKIASEIIAYRETEGSFKSVDELLLVSGIGKSKLKDLLPYVVCNIPDDPE